MNEISAKELYKLYYDTIAKCCTFNLNSYSDDELFYNLFEEFDIGVHSFFHDMSLARLSKSGLIDDVALNLSKKIREKWLSLSGSICDKTITAEQIKTDIAWQELFSLCDQLKSRLDGLK
jgi:hypothetical protein